MYHKGDKISYSGAKFTVVGFWGKFAKGDYSTLNSWSHLERKYRSKGVQFLGVSRDRKEGDVVKFVGRLGTFMRELGEQVRIYFKNPKKHKLKEIIVSPSSEAGEGEHKIYQFIQIISNKFFIFINFILIVFNYIFNFFYIFN